MSDDFSDLEEISLGVNFTEGSTKRKIAGRKYSKLVLERSHNRPKWKLQLQKYAEKEGKIK